MTIYSYYNDEGELESFLQVCKYEGQYYASAQGLRAEEIMDGLLPYLNYDDNGTLRYTGKEVYSVYIGGGLTDAALIKVLNMKQLGGGVLSAYDVYREYGGAEEGGWWYDCYRYLGPAKDFPADDDGGRSLGHLASNGHVVHRWEMIPKSHNTWHKPHYC